MTCPQCWSEATGVRKTLGEGGILIRLRGCRSCGVRWVTEETVRHITGGASEPGHPRPGVATPGQGRRSTHDLDLGSLDLGSPDPESEKRSSCAELVSEPVPELVPDMTFPCAGKVKAWSLTKAFLAELVAAYPDLPVEAECKRAKLWCEANRPKRKTSRGMKAFLATWMGNAQDRGRAGKLLATNGQRQPALFVPAPPPPITCEFHLYQLESLRGSCTPRCRLHNQPLEKPNAREVAAANAP